MQTKKPGDDLVSRPVDLEVSYDSLFPYRQEAYQRLLEDAVDGDHRRFGRADGVEETEEDGERPLDGRRHLRVEADLHGCRGI